MQQQHPIERFRDEFIRAQATEPFDGCRAALATCDPLGRPSVRFVLVKEFGADGFAFYTNYESPKAEDLERNPFAALSWHWDTTGVQVRARGPVRRVEDARSDAYFASRPRESQLGAWASPQSRVLGDRAALLQRLAEVRARFHEKPVPRPPFWGGYLVEPQRIEFWYNGDARLHERFAYQRADDGSWQHALLAP